MKKRMINIAGLFALPVVLFLFFSLVTEGFGIHSISIIISQCMIPTVIGFAMCTVINAGLMDFSPGARVVCGAVVGGLLSSNFGIAGLIVGCFAGGFIGAAVLGLLYRYLKIPSMVISLGVVLIFEVLGAKVSGSSGYVKIPNTISKVGSYPMNLVLTIIAGFILYIVFYQTKVGFQIKAVGNDEKMAKSMGVKTDKVKIYAYLISGIFCGFGAILQICYSGSVTSTIGMVTMSMVFKPMMGVLIGLQLVRLVDNLPLLIFIGELIIAIVFNGFIAMGLPDSVQNIVLGMFLLAVLGVSANSDSIAKWRKNHDSGKVVTND